MSPEAKKHIQQFHKEIRSSRILDNLTLGEIERMGDHVRFDDFIKGADILSEGNTYQGLWLILDGTCKVIKRCGDQENVLATLEPGTVFGEMSFFECVPHSASVRAETNVKTLCLTREEFEALRTSCGTVNEKIAINLVKLISERLRRMDGWTCELIETDGSTQQHQEWHDFRARLYSDIFD
ncbi:cyclic nucleotide-binding domain-containing protein [Thalassoglobus polymorphus]|uniref:cAMP receptor protein n=1 Tax=Thalassoglobus polymorphus TaxID=2527994 RepID=A0A517QLQ2_9PLAN|nr:cyclic nucleotide-binding domain-containing protein [Thalassoglobus polymorphus]QDT32541.1 cAMP receptor protein [Thalassoglobus polymorphus]